MIMIEEEQDFTRENLLSLAFECGKIFSTSKKREQRLLRLAFDIGRIFSGTVEQARQISSYIDENFTVPPQPRLAFCGPEESINALENDLRGDTGYTHYSYPEVNYGDDYTGPLLRNLIILEG